MPAAIAMKPRMPRFPVRDVNTKRSEDVEPNGGDSLGTTIDGLDVADKDVVLWRIGLHCDEAEVDVRVRDIAEDGDREVASWQRDFVLDGVATE